MKKFSALLIVVLLVALVASASASDGPDSLTDWLDEGQPERISAPAAPSSPLAPEALSIYYDRPTFDGDFPGLPIEGYEAIPDCGITGFDGPLSNTYANPPFAPGDILPGVEFSVFPGSGLPDLVCVGASAGFGNPDNLVAANFFVDGYSIDFNPPVQAAGMDLQSLLGGGGPCQVDVYTTAGYAGTDFPGCDPAGVFWGVSSDAEPITRIEIFDMSGGAEGADNIAFGSGGAGDTMHVHDMTGFFLLDYLGRPILHARVQVADQGHAPLSLVAVDASITVPDGGPHMRTRMTKPSGWARFHYGSVASGTWTLCVDDLTLGGYTYAPGDNVVTCMDWYN